MKEPEVINAVIGPRVDNVFGKEYIIAAANLHIFYERPLLEYVQCSYNQVQQITIDGHFEWKISRGIGEIPSYMFPEIQEKKYLRFDSII